MYTKTVVATIPKDYKQALAYSFLKSCNELTRRCNDWAKYASMIMRNLLLKWTGVQQNNNGSSPYLFARSYALIFKLFIHSLNWIFRDIFSKKWANPRDSFSKLWGAKITDANLAFHPPSGLSPVKNKIWMGRLIWPLRNARLSLWGSSLMKTVSV